MLPVISGLVAVCMLQSRTKPGGEDMKKHTEERLIDTLDHDNTLEKEEKDKKADDLNSFMEYLTLIHIDLENDSPGPLSEDVSLFSRNVLRKQRHWEKIIMAKKSKRKQEKERRKAKQPGNTDTGTNQQVHSKRFLKALTKERLLEAKDSGPRLCIDLSMTDHMSKKVDSTESGFLEIFPLESIIYLTPDSDSVLEDIDPSKVYVLGGLVDESIQKKVTYHKAKENGLQTARLPIQEYMVKKENEKNFHTEILAINQVFDVLCTYHETRSWPKALKAGVSLGKGFVLPDDDDEL
ncbi:tRNA methyltransferase 10 homolog B isoform 3-T5 [Mantella aurantiaca]